MGGLDVSAVTIDCVHLDVDMCGEMNATTAHDIISMTAEEGPDLNNVNTEVESIAAVESKPVSGQHRVGHEAW